MSKSTKPFRYRGRWRATLTLPNGLRPTKDFESYDDALLFLAEQRAIASDLNAPELGGPTQVTLAQALGHYAQLMTIAKKGARAELNRINHYLKADGLPIFKLIPNGENAWALQAYEPSVPKGFTAHLKRRQAQGNLVAQVIKKLAVQRCSQLNGVRFRELMTAMRASGLSESTIQKEIALIRHMFNIARTEWGWRGFENPTLGLKLGKSEIRFVKLTDPQRQAVFKALQECRSAYIWPMAQIALETTLRVGSLLSMRWSQTDLENRVVVTESKTGPVAIPLSIHAVQVLTDLYERTGRDREDDRVFPMSYNAVQMAWEGVREKAGVPTLQFKDLRHVGATDYAKLGLNAHELKVMLGHKSTRMAEVYVNLAAVDLLRKLDQAAPRGPSTRVLAQGMHLGPKVLPFGRVAKRR
jgi:integrase